MKNNLKTIIIIILACIIVALGAFLGIYIYKNNAPSAQQDISTASSSSTQAASSSISNSALDEILKQQMMYVNGIHYYYQSSSKQLTNDAMGASVYNNSEVSIKSFVVAFCAFDANGEPVKILQPNGEGEGGFVRTINYEFAKAQGDKEALAPGETCEDILMYVKNEPQIVTVKACVKSYISTDDISWSNPYYNTFLENYSGKAQKPEIMQTTSTASETTAALSQASSDTSSATTSGANN